MFFIGELFLRGFDQYLREKLAEEMQKQGIQLHFNEGITAIIAEGSQEKMPVLIIRIFPLLYLQRRTCRQLG